MRGSSPEELADHLKKQLGVWAVLISEAKLARE
jgi:hypothetical protein